MIKPLGKENVNTTSFTVSKNWTFSNLPENGVFLKDFASEDFVELTAVNYTTNPSSPIIFGCNLTLSNSDTVDAVQFVEAEKIDGHFIPENDPKTTHGFYKRTIYNTIKNLFYNTFKNPFNFFGSEFLDLRLSRTVRFFADKIRVFLIKQKNFGRAIKKKSVIINEYTFDDNVKIVDDGFGNLIAGENLFSKIQEVRKFGNIILDGSVSFICPEPSTTTTTSTSTTSTTTSTSTTTTTTTTTTSTTTTSTSTTTTSTTTTSTSTTTTSTTTTSTSTTTTSTTTTSTSTTTTSTTTTSTSTTTTTTTSTSTSTSTSTTSTTTTTTTTTTTLDCNDIDCLYFNINGTLVIDTENVYLNCAHWKIVGEGTDPECGLDVVYENNQSLNCECEKSTCTYFSACQAINSLIIDDVNSFLAVEAKESSIPCKIPGTPNTCSVLNSRFTVCFLPIINLYNMYYADSNCGKYYSVTHMATHPSLNFGSADCEEWKIIRLISAA